jgi:zinc D-Ala-D-Ala carboxypeptidase
MQKVTIEEFACGCGCDRHLTKVNKDFLHRLNIARNKTNVKFVINSGYRCPTYNITAGGVDGSSHTKGLAADIRALSDFEYFSIVEVLINTGFRRIGFGDGYIHVDNDISKPFFRGWTYYNELHKKIKIMQDQINSLKGELHDKTS